jgi:release factor glutamine methyltransferase
VLDLCTGSGAIAIAVKKEAEKQGKKIQVTAVDISADALEVAKKNAEINDADILFVQSDLFTRLRGRFDIIVSNPPYIPSKDIEGLQTEVRDFEPRLALDGGEDGLDIYRRIAKDYTKYLTRGGTLMMEVGIGEAEAIAKLSALTGKAYTSINVVGGGCQDAYLNAMTARACGLPVFAGPIEGTSLGNLMVQMIERGEFTDLQDARAAIRTSFEVKEYAPN